MLPRPRKSQTGPYREDNGDYLRYEVENRGLRLGIRRRKKMPKSMRRMGDDDGNNAAAAAAADC